MKQHYSSSLQDVSETRRRQWVKPPPRRHKDQDAAIHMENSAETKKKLNVGKLKQKFTKQIFKISLRNRFEVLQSNEAEKVEQRSSTFKKAVT